MNRKRLFTSLLLALILILSWSLRVWGINWDDGYHFHPDERMIIMVAERISWVNPITDWETFASKSSPMNPQFFAYGSFPIYLLAFGSYLASKFLGHPEIANYDGMLIVGRLMSGLFDSAIVVIIYLMGRKIKDRKLGLISAFLYSIAVFPIQTSHFFAVDTLLSLLISGLGLGLVYIKKLTWKNALIIGILEGLAIGTKASGGLGLGLIGLWWVYKTWKDIQFHLTKGKIAIKTLSKNTGWGLGVVATILVTVSIVQPYMWYDKVSFGSDIKNQARMRYDAWTFPYTRQYIGTTPYVYHGGQIIKYGLGWAQAGLVMVGMAALFYILKSRDKRFNKTNLMVIASTMILFIGPFGMYSVKFMRYLLPIYAGMTIISGLGIVYWTEKFAGLGKQMVILGFTLSIAGALGWTAGFMAIYGNTNTRITASKWMWNNLASGSNIAIEHWDDALPVPPWQGKFTQTPLALYENDDIEKWQEISHQLEESDAIVIASNRLYTPLMRLVDKYPVASKYYKKLFAGELGYEVAFTASNYPKIGKWIMNDDEADESFHVYDHPKVIILVKKHEYTANQYYDLITEDKL